MGSMTYDVFIYCDLVMLLQSEILYVYTAVIHDTMDKSNATYVTIWTVNTTTTSTTIKTDII
jgi:hypothetical protein